MKALFALTLAIAATVCSGAEVQAIRRSRDLSEDAVVGTGASNPTTILIDPITVSVDAQTAASSPATPAGNANLQAGGAGGTTGTTGTAGTTNVQTGGSSNSPSSTTTTTTTADATATVPSNTTTTSTTSTSSTTTTTTATTANGTSTSVGTNPLLIKGYRFFDSVTGEYFAVRGVDYYPRPNAGANDKNNLDFFTDEFAHVWQRDIPHFVALSANAIRLYAVDPTVDHSAFMCTLQAAGIYVMVDLGSSCQGCEITADSAPTCYPATYRDRGEAIIAQFAQYDNVLGFSAGNEINHRTGGHDWTWNAPCQKKFIRDMRAFIAGCPDMRQVPVGVVMADTNRDSNAQYYNCLTDPSDKLESIEWYGINVYVHCNDEPDETKAAGFNLLRDSFKSYKYSIPTLLTEFGCLSEGFPTEDGFAAQRTFHDAKFMNLREYSDYFNGGFVFEFTTENANSKSTSPYPFKTYGAQNYGIGYLTPEDCDDVKGGKLCDFERFPNYDNLAEAYASYSSKGEPTFDTFQVPADRTKPSECPAGSPKLKDFKWESDTKSSKVTCPTTGRHQCPAMPLNKITKSNTKRHSMSGSGSAEAGYNKHETTKYVVKEDEEEESEASEQDSGSGSSKLAKSAAAPMAAVSSVLSAMVLVVTAALLC